MSYALIIAEVDAASSRREISIPSASATFSEKRVFFSFPIPTQ